MILSGYSGNINNEETDDMSISKGVVSLSSAVSYEDGGEATLSGTSESSIWEYGYSDSAAQVQLAWYYVKSGTRILATWYSTEDFDESNIYLFFGRTKFSNVAWYLYAGSWKQNMGYGKNTVVQYDNKCYISTSNNNLTEPDTGNWSIISLPDVSAISASWRNYAVIPADYDYVVSLNNLAQGNMYIEDVTNNLDYDSMYIVMSVCLSQENNGGYNFDGAYASPSKRLYTERFWDSANLSARYNNTNNTISITDKYTNTGSYINRKYLMEFYRTGYNPVDQSNRIRDEFFLTAMVNLEDEGIEGYGNLASSRLHKWRRGTYTVGIVYDTIINRRVLYNAINNAIYELNQKMNSYGIYFNKIATTNYADTTGDITFYCQSNDDICDEFDVDYDNGAFINGHWNTTIDNDGYISSATIKLNAQICHFQTFDSVAMEELLQCMGAGYDQADYPTDTIHCNFTYVHKPDYIGDIDAGILDILYSGYVSVNMTAQQVALAVNPTNGAIVANATQSLNFLESGKTYTIKVYLFSDEISSPVSLTVTIPDDEEERPDKFYWTTSIQTGASVRFDTASNSFRPVTAAEWNAFCSKINEFRRYKGLSEYSFTTVSTGMLFTAAIYNEAVAAINEISDSNKSTIPYAIRNRTNAIEAENYLILNRNLNLIQ